MKKDDLTFTNLVKNLKNCPVRVLLQPIYTGEPSGKNHPSVVSSSKKKTKKNKAKISIYNCKYPVTSNFNVF